MAPGPTTTRAADLSMGPAVLPDRIVEWAPGLREHLKDWNEGEYLHIQWNPFRAGQPAGRHTASLQWSPEGLAEPAWAVWTLAAARRWPGGWGVIVVAVRDVAAHQHIRQATWAVTMPYFEQLPDGDEAGQALGDPSEDEEEPDFEENLERVINAISGVAQKYKPETEKLVSWGRWWWDHVGPGKDKPRDGAAAVPEAGKAPDDGIPRTPFGQATAPSGEAPPAAAAEPTMDELLDEAERLIRP